MRTMKHKTTLNMNALFEWKRSVFLLSCFEDRNHMDIFSYIMQSSQQIYFFKDLSWFRFGGLLYRCLTYTSIVCQLYAVTEQLNKAFVFED